MEKIINRNKYWLNFYEFCNKVELNQSLINGLTSHPYFKDYMKTVMKFPDELNRKICIFSEFTRMRSTCEAVEQLLRYSGQIEAADELKWYNTSPGRMAITETDVIPVQTGREVKGTLYYSMSKKPRGKCVIINNFVELRNGTFAHNSGLYKESKRFESIFTQLYFDVIPIDTTMGLTAKGIRNRLQIIAEDETLENSDAFIVMIISHGRDETVCGYDACRELDPDPEDVIKISEIVDIFSDNNCKHLKNKPKLFFFNCCRNKVDIPCVGLQLEPNEEPVYLPIISSNHTFEVNLIPNQNRVLIQLKTIDQKWANENKDIFISYSCSEGQLSFFKRNIGISNFGQALSHSIAQYACEESLQSILSRTCDYIEIHYNELKDENFNDKSNKYSITTTPEIRGQFMRRQLFLNPGFHK